VLPGTDLTAQSTATGFELSLLVTDVAAAAALPDSIDLPLAGKGLTWSIDGGVLTARDASDTMVVTSAGASAWDATRGEHTDEPLRTANLTLSLSGTAGAQVLHVATPRALLNDPATVFPVTIDPSATWSETAWTYVDSGFPSTSYYNDAGPAKVGTFNSGGDKDRTLFRFGTAGLAGKHIINATFHIWEKWSWSCTARAFDIWGVPGSFNSGTTWNNQPGLGVKRATITAAKGYDDVSCPAGGVSADLTDWTQVVADAGVSYDELELRSPNETDNTYWKKFNIDPHLSITYNSYPGTASSLSVKPCSSQCSATVLTNTTTPTLTGKTSDPDGGTLRYNFQVWDNAGADLIASTTTSGIASGATASWNVWGSHLTNGTTYKYKVRAYDGTDYGPWSNWLAFKVDTTAPATPTVSSDTWDADQDNTARSGTVSWSSTSADVAAYSYYLDNANWSVPSSASQVTLSNLTNNYRHKLCVHAIDKAGNISSNGCFAFTVGHVSATTPTSATSTSRYLELSVPANAQTPSVVFEWRAAGSSDPWSTIASNAVIDKGTRSTPSPWPSAPTGSNFVWDLSKSVAVNAWSSVIAVRACLNASGGTSESNCGSSVSVAYTPHDSQGDRQDVGPGSVALTTGNLSVSTSDFSAWSLAVDRQYATWSDPAGSIGPGWVNVGPGWQLTTNGAVEFEGATVTFVTNPQSATLTLDGTTVTYGSPVTSNGLTTLTTADDTTSYVTVNADATTLTLVNANQSETTWNKQTDGTWQLAKTVDYNLSGSSLNRFYTSGHLAAVVEQPASNLACRTLASALTTEGCRSLTMVYGTQQSGGAPLLSHIDYTAWSPSSSAMTTVTVVEYSYDTSGRLVSTDDPRIAPALVTAYSYDGSGRLASETDPGLAPWTFTYDDSGRLIQASRQGTGGAASTQTVVYDIPLAGTGLADLSKQADAAWGETSDLPMGGGAVFTATHVPSGTTTATVEVADWKYATIRYFDDAGREVNEASYGSGQWQITTTQYNDVGDPDWALSASNRQRSLTPDEATPSYVAALSDSADRAGQLTTRYSYDATGRVVGTVDPMRSITDADGTTEARVVTSYDYSDSSSDSPSTTTTAAYDAVGTRQAYSASNDTYADGQSTAQADVNAAGQLTVEAEGGDDTWQYSYDPQHRITSMAAPGDSSGATQRSTRLTYYGSGSGTCAGAASTGSICQEGSAASNAGSTVTYSYNEYGEITTTVTTSGTATKTDTNTYDLAGRLVGQTQSFGGVDSQTSQGATPATALAYSSTTGLLVETTATIAGATRSVSKAYDTFGRLSMYTDGYGSTTTYAYDAADHVVRTDDQHGQTSYAWDSATEHRGLLTSESAGSVSASFTYDADGQEIAEAWSNGITADLSYDPTGTLTARSYTSAAGPLIGYTDAFDSQGRLTSRSTDASMSTYTYDSTGREATRQVEFNSANSVGAACAAYTYQYDSHSNLTSLALAADPACDGNAQTTTSTMTYAASDAPTTSGYATDAFGRITSAPLASDHASFTYWGNDQLASEQLGQQSVQYDLDPNLDRVGQARISSTSGDTVVTPHYSDDVDTPDAYATAGGDWTQLLRGPTGQILALVEGSSAQFLLHDIDGNATGTSDAASDGTLDAYADYGDAGEVIVGSAVSSYAGWQDTAATDLPGVAQLAGSAYLTSARLALTPRSTTLTPSAYSVTASAVMPDWGSTGYCSDHSKHCYLAFLHAGTDLPERFRKALHRNSSAKHGGKDYYVMIDTKAGRRAVLRNGDHCTKSPDTGFAWNFKNACDTHDLGYDVEHYWHRGGILRRASDSLINNDMKADCKHRFFLARPVCYNVAYTIHEVIDVLSLGHGYAEPGHWQ
jgi:YD repeat-containing protein